MVNLLTGARTVAQLRVIVKRVGRDDTLTWLGDGSVFINGVYDELQCCPAGVDVADYVNTLHNYLMTKEGYRVERVF